MNGHDDFKEQLAVYKQLDPAARARVDAHLEACASCREKLAAYRLMDRRLAGLADAHPGPALRAGFYSALAKRPAPSHRPSLFSRAAGAGLQLGALALVVVLVLTVWWGLRDLAVPAAPAVTPPLTTHSPFQGARLLGYELREPFAAGADAPLSLYWLAYLPVPEAMRLVLQLVDEGGQVVAHGEDLVDQGEWLAGSQVETQHTLSLPPELPDGRYRLQVGLFFPDSERPIEFMTGGEIRAGMITLTEITTGAEWETPLPSPSPSLETGLTPFSAAALATAAALDFAPMWSPQSYKMWSPDEVWVAYWTVSAQDRYDYSQDSLHFLNLQTGQSCPYPHPASRQIGAGHRVGWLDNEQVVVFQVHGRGRLGSPCGSEWAELEEPLETYPQLGGMLSPDGRYLARRLLSSGADVSSGDYGRLHSTISIENQMGDVIHGLTIIHALTYEDALRGNVTEPGYELWLNFLLSDQAKWLGDDYLLIHAMPEIGPLLLHVGHRNIHVTADLFQRLDLVNDYQSTFSPPYAEGAFDPVSGQYTLLLWPPSFNLGGVSPEGAEHPLLYHSATGTIERVPHTPAVSGQWLAIFDVDSPTSPTGSSTHTVRLRPIDPPGNDNYASYSSRQAPIFNTTYSRMAVPGGEDGRISIHSVPDWSLLAQWELPGYGSGLAYHSSPSGRWLLYMAPISGGGQEGLFVIPFE
jgi:hypothetical protein